MIEPAGTTPAEDASSPPPPWFAEPCMLGIDEAGRGPVLGSMVYGAAIAPLADKDALAGGRFADSKVLSEAAREAGHAAILGDARLAWRVAALSAASISAAMLGKGGGTSLNALAWDSTCALLDGALSDGANLTEVFVDTVGDPEAWAGRLKTRYPSVKTFTVCPKADALFPIVSAASIVAKVTRDREVAALAAAAAAASAAAGAAAREDAPPSPAMPLSLGPPLPMGSGYPGDPVTKAWLEAAAHRVFGFPACTRFSWATVENALAPPDRGAAVRWEDDEGAPGAGQARLGFGSAAQKGGCERDGGGPSSGVGRPSYFRARRLQRVALC